MVKLGIGGKALYVLVRAVSVRPNMEPDVKEETAEKEKRERWKVFTGQGRAQSKQVEKLSWKLALQLPGVVGCGSGWYTLVLKLLLIGM